MTPLEILKQEAESMYRITARLIEKVDADSLQWKPQTGSNWMTVGQLVMHCTNSCGLGIKGFLTGDWGLPEGVKFEDLPPDQMLPPAEAMPSVESISNALELLAEDRKLAMSYLSDLDEESLLTRTMTAPWGGPEATLFQHLSHMISHLEQHKGQLFYYLKLMGKNMSTMDMYGM